ncbi:MAG TPA: hypothetical protein VGS22_24150 [Thermoanaerobaculia bacterium]|jgi:hypothetical protein|nr:hypothetical protein [Thermoanaerobaculia bacterium]
MKKVLIAALVAILSGGISAFAAEIFLPASNLRVDKFIPLAELSQHPELIVIRAVDPLAIYSNVTGFSGMAFAQGAATGGITRMVMDDLTFTTNPGVSNVTMLRFSVANLNTTSQSVRARVRFWVADGPSLGAGLANAPGTYYTAGGGFSFNPLTFAPGVTTLTGNVAPGFPVPAGTTTTLWAGLTFDNVGTTTGATDTEMSNFGQAMFNPIDLGSSTNTLFETTAAGSFLGTNNPPGAALNFGGSPLANQGWEFVVTTLPIGLTDFSVD